MEVTQNQEFLMLQANDVCELIASDDLNVPNEETVYYALLAWVNHDIPTRSMEMEKLLAQIRLPLLTPQVSVNFDILVLVNHDIPTSSMELEIFVWLRYDCPLYHR